MDNLLNLSERSDKSSNRTKEPLFEYNGKIYYGNKSQCYDSMCLFSENQTLSFETLPVLGSDAPEYLMELYVESLDQSLEQSLDQSLNNHLFNIMSIDQDEKKNESNLLKFLKLIDQYPTKQLSIDLLENELIRYMDERIGKIGKDQMVQIIEIFDKYQLKTMCLYLHQNNLST